MSQPEPRPGGWTEERQKGMKSSWSEHALYFSQEKQRVKQKAVERPRQKQRPIESESERELAAVAVGGHVREHGHGWDALQGWLEHAGPSERAAAAAAADLVGCEGHAAGPLTRRPCPYSRLALSASARVSVSCAESLQQRNGDRRARTA